MHAVRVHEAGGPEALVYEEVPTPGVRAGWSLVRVRGFGINHSEIFTRQGLSPSVTFPRILGIECVGEVAASSDEARLPLGRRVVCIMGEMGRAFDGSYAEYVLVPNEMAHPVDTSLPWELLAAVPETYYTAYGSLLNLNLEPHVRVLVRGATSGVGVAFLHLVKALYPAARVTGSTRSESKRAALLRAGFDDVVLDRGGSLQVEGVFDRALELVGPATLGDTCAHIARGGIVCSTGQLGGQWTMEGFDPITNLPQDGYLTSFYSGNVDEGLLNELLALVERHRIDVAPERVFSLDEVPAAHAYLEGSGGFGKVVVMV